MCSGAVEAPGLRLGVVWYLVRDETHNGDGKHVAYLNPDHRAAAELSRLDSDLYRRLAQLVGSGVRSVAGIAASGALPPETLTFEDHLYFGDLPRFDRTARSRRRRDWLVRALAATEGCDMVFVDPDNGIRPSSHATKAHRDESVKHA